ncbi:hypothetical protein EWM64_g4965 [Hericium alpestre]|uniref:Integrase catalytic domain-containing protein n=1 Tax=Hericium alpestre TaxID=135208 RepID=A0A4Y9ZYM7_9AGAM|nr:hypothetical protein EWM64_g4965 [Hericium alpestre]
MSTSFHPQTDGALERVICSIGQILRNMVSPSQEDWVDQIPMVEFMLNSTVSSSSGFAPFKLNYGYMPTLGKQPVATIPYKGVKAFAERAHAYLNAAHDAIIESCINQAYYANTCHMPEVEYKIHDLVYLSTKNLNMPKGRAAKLLPKYIRLFKVLESNPGTSTLV